MRILMGGAGGGMAGFGSRSSSGMDSAIQNLQGPAPANRGMAGVTRRDLSAGVGPGRKTGCPRASPPGLARASHRRRHLLGLPADVARPATTAIWCSRWCGVIRTRPTSATSLSSPRRPGARSIGPLRESSAPAARWRSPRAGCRTPKSKGEAREAANVPRAERGQEVAITFPWVFQVAGRSPD